MYFLFSRTTLQVLVTYLTGALCMHPLWFYKHQHDNRVRSTQNTFSLPFAVILVNCAPSRKIHNYCTPHIRKENFENFLIHGCNYILLSQAYCVWQVVKTLTVILNNPVLLHEKKSFCALLIEPPGYRVFVLKYDHQIWRFMSSCTHFLTWYTIPMFQGKLLP